MVSSEPGISPTGTASLTVPSMSARRPKQTLALWKRHIRQVPQGDIAGASRPSPATPGVRCLTVKLHVEAVPIWGAPGGLEGTALGIAPKQKPPLARKFFGFQDSAIFQKDAGARCDIAACFDDAIITQ
jgi:hypothetical protein